MYLKIQELWRNGREKRIHINKYIEQLAPLSLLPESTDVYLLLITKLQTSTDEINVTQDAHLPVFPSPSLQVSPQCRNQGLVKMPSLCTTHHLSEHHGLSAPCPSSEQGVRTVLPECQVFVLLQAAMAHPAKS